MKVTPESTNQVARQIIDLLRKIGNRRATDEQLAQLVGMSRTQGELVKKWAGSFKGVYFAAKMSMKHPKGFADLLARKVTPESAEVGKLVTEAMGKALKGFDLDLHKQCVEGAIDFYDRHDHRDRLAVFA